MIFADELIKLMPRKFRAPQRWQDLMQAWGEVMDGVHAKIDGLPDLHDEDAVPVAYMQHLADLLGFELFVTPGTDSDARRRVLLKSIVAIIKMKGFKSLLESLATFFYFSQFVGTSMTVYELWTIDYETFTLGDLSDSYTPAGWVGDGVTKAFSTNIRNTPVRIRSVKVTSTDVNGNTLLVWDDRNGALKGNVSVWSIDYTTGAISITFTTPPRNGENVTISYVLEGGQYLSPHFVFAFPIDIYQQFGLRSISHSIGTGDGSELNFTSILAYPVVAGSLTITATDIFGLEMIVTDDGFGNLIGDVGSGNNTIDYDTGVLDVSFEAPVAAGGSVIASYQYNDVFLGRSYFNRMISILDKFRPVHTVRHIEIGTSSEFWRVGFQHWRVGGSGVSLSQSIRVGGVIWP